MLKLEIIDTFVESRSGTSTNGRAWRINSQTNCFLTINEERRRFPVNLPENTGPFAPGLYEFDGEALLTVGRYGLEVDRFKPLNLKPVVAAVDAKESTKPLFNSAKG